MFFLFSAKYMPMPIRIPIAIGMKVMRTPVIIDIYTPIL